MNAAWFYIINTDVDLKLNPFTWSWRLINGEYYFELALGPVIIALAKQYPTSSTNYTEIKQ